MRIAWDDYLPPSTTHWAAYFSEWQIAFDPTLQPHLKIRRTLRFSQRTFPHTQYSPTHRPEFINRASVALNVGLKLGSPEFLARCGQLGKSAPMVKMPKTAVNKDSDPATWHDDVRGTWQVTPMQPESVARREQQPTDMQLGLRVLALDARHHSATIYGRNDINHWLPRMMLLLVQARSRCSTSLPEC